MMYILLDDVILIQNVILEQDAISTKRFSRKARGVRTS